MKAFFEPEIMDYKVTMLQSRIQFIMFLLLYYVLMCILFSDISLLEQFTLTLQPDNIFSVLIKWNVKPLQASSLLLQEGGVHTWKF